MFLTGYGIPYPDWPQDIKDQYTYNPAGAKKLLADAGYASGFTTNIATTASADQDLLQIALSDMAAVNIKCNIQMMDSAAYSAYTRGFKTDGLFYGGGALGLSFQPLMMFMKYQTGYAGNYSMFSDATYDSCYARAIAATSTDAFKQILLDENIDLARKHVGISLLTPKYFAFIQPWFKGYNGQDGALTRSASDWFFGFYTSRFWIDVNIKKSYGH
jgi:peptide/nickel transport system substrate-binding protein